MTLLSTLGGLTLAYIFFKLTSFIVATFFRPSTNWSKYGAKKGSWALITGSTDGIGKEFALQLAKQGLNIILVSRNADKLKATKDQILKESPSIKIETSVVDFSETSGSSLSKFLSSLKDKKVSVLVNNVGVSHSHPEYFTESRLEDLESIIMVNIMNTIRLTKGVLPGMVENRNGLILNLGSFSGETPIPLLQTYSASKSFLKTWSLALSAEMVPKGVDVQLLNTYFVVSNMSKRKRPTWMIPTPRNYVKWALKLAGQNDFTTPYPSHALLELIMGLVPTTILTMVNLAQMRAVRQIALERSKKY